MNDLSHSQLICYNRIKYRLKVKSFRIFTHVIVHECENKKR